MRLFTLRSATIVAFGVISACGSGTATTTTTTTFTVDPASTTTAPPSIPPSTTIALVPMGRPAVILEPAWDIAPKPVHVNVGDTIAFVAPAYGTYFHEDGSVYDPDRPSVSDPGLMQEALYTESCADHGTCAAWIALAAGTATVYESGPSGIVCDLIPGTTELSCMAIATAHWSQEIVIDEP